MNAISPVPRVITAPGIYDMAAEVYHADPCQTPSLSAGMINDLLIAPAKCWFNSRRLNPDWEEPEGQEKFTIGAVAHLIFLEPKRFRDSVCVVEADDWRKKEAKQARDEARADGLIPILEKHMDRVMDAREVFNLHPLAAPAFQNGQAEKSIFWQHPVYGFWCRARPDFIADAGHLCDYKTTGNADPQEFGKHAYKLGYHRRAAWYIDGMRALGREPTHYWFINQETAPPHLISVVELDDNAIEAGRAENDKAAALFARCLQTQDWFGYRHREHQSQDRAFRVGLPNFAYYQIDERNA